MAKDRMIRAEMRESEKVNGWPIHVRYFWTQLWGYCDDWGRGRYDARLIKAGTFPIDDEVTPEVVMRWMRGLEQAGVVVSYEVGGKRYFECVNWHEHQELSYLKKTNIPDRSGVIPTSGKRSKSLPSIPENSGPREGEVEGKEKEKGISADGTPPQFCPNHPSGTPEKCGPCGDARRIRKAYDIAQASRPTPRPVNAGDCPSMVARGAHRFVGGYCAECSVREEGAG